MAKMRLYDFQPSGNCYKIRLLCRQLQLQYDRIAVDVLGGENTDKSFRKLNPSGRIPAMVWDDGRRLSESNAILWYLAGGTHLLPSDHTSRSHILQWFSFEQYSHEPHIAVSRYWCAILGQADEYVEQLQACRDSGYHALSVMEVHLKQRKYLVNDCYSIADIALYAGTHVAEEGGFSLADYPSIRAWLKRVSCQPNHLGIAA